VKLAEALIVRADCQKNFEQLKQRIVRSAKVQEGDEPPENPNDLMAECERVAEQLADLIKRINRTNSRSEFQPGVMVSDALAYRDVLSLRRRVYSDLAQAASVTQAVYSKSEVRFKAPVNVADIQKKVDELSKEYREMDARIQEINWKIDLVE
jgi:hypothetical protein